MCFALSGVFETFLTLNKGGLTGSINYKYIFIKTPDMMQTQDFPVYIYTFLDLDTHKYAGLSSQPVDKQGRRTSGASWKK